MISAKQKAAREKFKKVVAEAKKLRKKNPSLTQGQAVKQAWAISYSKAGKIKVGSVVKKSAPKKSYKDWTNATDADVIKNFVPYLEEYVKDGKKYWNSYGLEKRNGKWVETYNYRFDNLKKAKENILAEYGELPEVRKTKKIGAMKKKATAKKKSASKKKAAPKKKAAAKKVTGSHKDTKSHNVNIRVISGIDKVKNDTINKYKEVLKDIKYYEDAIKRIKDSISGLISPEKIRAKLVIKNFTKIKNELKIHSKELKKLI